jgi:two-component sensor histidine kinase/Tfp pilus assembly protein PilF
MKIFSFVASLFFFALAAIGQDDNGPSLEKVQLLKEDTAKVYAWIELSEFALKQSFEKGYDYANSALNLAQTLEFDRGIYRAHEQIGRAVSYMGEYKLAFEHYEKANRYYKEYGDQVRQAATLNRMGETKRLLDEYEEALTYMQESLKINGELGDTNEMGSGYISIGILYAVRGDKKEAERYFLKAIESFKAIDNKPREFLTVLNMGGLYNEMAEYEKAVEFSLRARDYFAEFGPEIRLGVVYFNLGVSYFELHQLKESKKYYEKGLTIFEKLGDKLRINGSNLRLAEIDLELGNTTQALANAELALASFKEVGSLSQIVFSYRLISNIYKAQKNFEKALDYRVLYEEMLDSVNGQETKTRIAELEEKYQSEVKDKELEKARADIELSELVLQKQRNQKFAFMAFAIFILVISVLIFNQYRIKKRNNDTLRDKNAIIENSLAEKEVLLKEIHHRVKNNLQFISSLLNLQTRHISDPETQAVLIEGKNRVQSMALVHQKLYQEENLRGVQMREYVENLVESLVHSLKIDRTKIVVHVDVDPVYLDIDTAMPVGMILNELITNAFKYAFVNRTEGELNVSLKVTNEHLNLLVADNGIGFPKDFENENEGSFGFKLINSLAGKLKAELKTSTEKGARVELNISNFKTS